MESLGQDTDLIGGDRAQAKTEFQVLPGTLAHSVRDQVAKITEFLLGQTQVRINVYRGEEAVQEAS